jgi:murein DD-endopeptidase MepM/ murein hydrolase activator NlpD
MKGWAELLLCTAVLAAAWTRTPVGTLAHNAWAWSQDQPTDDILASFRTTVPARLDASIESALAAHPPGESLQLVAEGGWTPALQTAVIAHLGAESLPELQALDREDPRAALEISAIGTHPRQRAIARARASGESDPEPLANHSRYLSKEHAGLAERQVAEVLSLATALDLAWPVDPTARVSSGFGYRHHPVLSRRKLHEGVDIAVPVGTPVHSAGAGRVTRSRKDGVNGNHVIVDHGNRVRTAYCHGDKLHVDKGAQVARGRLIMDSGNTGRSTGAHLHFGLRIKGRAIDPAPFRAISAATGAGFAVPEAKPKAAVPPETTAASSGGVAVPRLGEPPTGDPSTGGPSTGEPSGEGVEPGTDGAATRESIIEAARLQAEGGTNPEPEPTAPRADPPAPEAPARGGEGEGEGGGPEEAVGSATPPAGGDTPTDEPAPPEQD